MGYEANPADPREQRSTLVRVLVIIAAVIFVVLLLCVGGVGLGLWMIQRAVQQELADLDAAIRDLDAAALELDPGPAVDPNAVRVVVAQMFDDFEVDPVAAAADYGERLIEVDGVVENWDADTQVARLSVGTSAIGDELFVSAVLGDAAVPATFPFSPGDKIRVCGFPRPMAAWSELEFQRAYVVME